MNNWEYAAALPTTPWRGQMTAPRKLALRSFAEGIRLVQEPIDGLSKQHGRQLKLRAGDPGAANRQVVKFGPGEALDLDVHFSTGTAAVAGVRLRKGGEQDVTVGYDVRKQELFVDRTKAGDVGFHPRFPSRTVAPLAVSGGKLSLRILLDSNSIEVFADAGRVAMTNLIFPRADALGLEFFAEGGKAAIHSGSLWDMKPYK